MSKYFNVIYNTDTYGIRMRGDIQISAMVYDYDRVLVTIDDSASKFPTGTRIMLTRSLGYWPELPYGGGHPGDTVPAYTDAAIFYATEYVSATPPEPSGTPPVDPESAGSLYDQSVSSLHTAVVGYSGFDTIPRKFIDKVTPGSIVYYRIYVSEPLGEVATADYSDNDDDVKALLEEREAALAAATATATGSIYRWTPWEIRGQNYVVVPNDLGGIRTAIDAYPVGLMTGGDVYGAVDPDSTQYQFISHVGFLSDLLSTDGSHIVDDMDFLHPNMVRPMLYGFGMTEEEDFNINAYYATWNSLNDSPLLKRVLYNYRDITMRKGSKDSFIDYYRTAFALPSIDISLPENLLLSVVDASPFDITTDGPYTVEEYPVGTYTPLESGPSYSSPVILHAVFDHTSGPGTSPALRNSSVFVSGAKWTRQYTGNTAKQYAIKDAGIWTDQMTSSWSNSPQDSLVPHQQVSLNTAVGNGTTVTYTVNTGTAHAFVPGMRVTVSGFSPSGYNGTDMVITATNNATTFTVANTTTGSSSGTTKIATSGGYLLPDVIGAYPADTWATDDTEYVQHTDFVYQLQIPRGGMAVLGSAWTTRSVSDTVTLPYPDISYAIRLHNDPAPLTLRMRLLKEKGTGTSTVSDIWTYVDWMDNDGEFLSREYFSPTASFKTDLNGTLNTWHSLEIAMTPPSGARYLSWGLVMSAGTGTSYPYSPVVCVGAIQVAPFDVSTYPTYRNPRSVIVLADYTSDYPTALQTINVAKMTKDAANRLPMEVTHRVMTNLSDGWDVFSAVPTLSNSDIPATAPTYASARISYTGTAYDADYPDGNPIADTTVTYSQSTDIPEE